MGVTELAKKKNNMVKIGPTFSDFISEQRLKNRRRLTVSFTGDVFSVASLFLLIAVFAVLVIRVFYLQVVRYDYYKKLSDGNRLSTKTLYAERGIIFDRKGRPLVRNIPTFKTRENGKVTHLDKDEVLGRMTQEGEKKIETDIKRFYLYNEVFAHVIGYTGEIGKEELLFPQFEKYEASDVIGKMGLEQWYEQTLHGTNGRELYEVDAKGNIIRPLGSKESVPGKNLSTTLDLDIQRAAKDAFSEVTKGAVVVSDPRDGGVLALFSKPTFDPNLFTQQSSYKTEGAYKKVEDVLSDEQNFPLLNRAISGLYPPGSTFKPITAIAALETGAITADTKIEDVGVLQVGTFSYGNWYFLSYGKTEGLLDVVGAIKRSNDIFFYKTAEAAGVDEIASWAKKFGMGENLGIDLAGEEQGVIPGPSWKKTTLGEQWYLGDTYHLGIGQGYILVSPLQINMLTSAIANGGILYKPHLLSGKKEVIRRDFFKKEHVELVREGMRQSCEQGGVAWPLFDFKVDSHYLPVDGRDFIEVASGSAQFVKIPIGCKTGTAETTKNENPHAWITLFAPFYNPEIAVTVLVENGGEGSNIAAPIAKKILEEYFRKR